MLVPDPSPSREPEIERRVLDVLIALSEELRGPSKRRRAVTLDSKLTEDLGLDSLARTEALLRIQQCFDTSLPDTALLAETARDLVQMLEAKDRPLSPHGPSSVPASPLTGLTEEPTHARTLVEVVDWHAERHGEREHLRLLGERDSSTALTYADLVSGARTVAANLQQAGLTPGGTVAIMLPTSLEYFLCFVGTLIAGGIPVPIYPPLRPSQIAEHLRRHRRILANAGTQFLIVDVRARPVAQLLRSYLKGARTLFIDQDLIRGEARLRRVRRRPQDEALLQYTSGSTGEPKGVVLSHDNLLDNIRAMATRLEVTSEDVFVSWLPLYHDMGLIGAWMGSLYLGCRLIVMSPLHFLARPSRWLWAVDRYGGTLSASPNFGYELCRRKVPDREIEGLSLGTWRHALNGAEPVSPHTVRGFCQRFAPYGFRPEALKPVYGLAESSVGLAMPDHGAPARIRAS